MSEADVTRLLHEARRGDSGAQDALIETLYGELRRLAGSLMYQERPGHTLQPTALVNEAWMRLMCGESGYENRSHFFGAAARAMRRILVDYARERKAQKRGGDAKRVTISDVDVKAEDPQVDLLALDEALSALSEENERLGRMVELRYFAGLSVDDVAKILGVSDATVRRDWVYARAWLYDYMSR
jgi:RNA polymerase sigma factor (TIGR02999 family)